MPTSQTSADIDAALGTLINLSGKMRMLSHRAAMFALLACGTAGSGGLRHLAEFDAARAEFRQIHLALTEGNPDLGVPREAAVALAASPALDANITGPIERFLDTTDALRGSLAGGHAPLEAVEAFVAFVAGDLLSSLNRLTEAIGGTLRSRFATRHQQTAQARTAMLKAIGSISDVSMKVKLISLNASIEAARAGANGKSFGVIATEIRTLSEDAAQSAQGLREQLEMLAAP